LEITFHTNKLAKACNETRIAVATFGLVQAKRLRQRLDDLHAAHDLAVMRSLPGRCHELVADRKGQLSIDLQHPYRLIFVPAHSPIPLKPDGGLDWSAVTRIEILEIADTHG
jgi:plasmid maintenance system killer protein